MTPAWPCGHPLTRANTQSIGRGGQTRCRICRRVTAKESARRRRLREGGSVSPEVSAALVKLAGDGMGAKAIAWRLRLSSRQVMARAKRLGMDLHP